MKRFTACILIFFMLLLGGPLTGCTGGTDESSGESPTQEPKYAPEDIFQESLHFYGEEGLPHTFQVFGVSFDTAAEQAEGKNIFTVSMTAPGDGFDAISYHADAAGLPEDVKKDRIDEYMAKGMCVLEGDAGQEILIRKTIPEDDRYQYVEGCLIEIKYYIDEENVEKYIKMAQDNYSAQAVAPLEEHLGKEPDWTRIGFFLNSHKNIASFYVAYPVDDVPSATEGITQNLGDFWYDAESGMLGFLYGILDIRLDLVENNNTIYVTQTMDTFDTPFSDYIPPENSLTQLGFGFDEDMSCGVYEVREPRYTSIAIHRPEWGDFPENWNIEYMDQINGVPFRVTYHAQENYYHFMVEEKAAYNYYLDSQSFTEEHPSYEVVEQAFNQAFGTQGDDFYEMPLLQFQQVVQEYFGLTVEELYQLPIR